MIVVMGPCAVLPESVIWEPVSCSAFIAISQSMNVVVGPGAAAHYPAAKADDLDGLAPPVGGDVTFNRPRIGVAAA